MSVQTYAAVCGAIVCKEGGEFVNAADYRAVAEREINLRAQVARLRAALHHADDALHAISQIAPGAVAECYTCEAEIDAALIDTVTAPIVFAREHTGMKMSADGLLTRCARIMDRSTEGQAAGYSFALRDQLLKHLHELARRYYGGDAAVVDEFLQLYCLGAEEREAVLDARKERA